ncbi:MAG: DUF1361 domain-containing protein [Verrucomicrobia bacterium]|nr:DUF1361 domain-containing protein [Verrucomicrobiota bacterium]
MKLLKLLYQRETVAPMLAMTFASAVSVALVLARIAWTGQFYYAFLIGNLFLAWLPLIFAVLACEQYERPTKSNEPTPCPSREGNFCDRASVAAPLLGGVRGGFVGKQNWRFAGLAGAWLLFFPNAPYIFTDVIHLLSGRFQHFWVDLTLILLCAFTGLVLGFVSLYLMQSVVRRIYGWAAGWFFVAGVAGLSSFGIYLGRFLRFNSWDVLIQPVKLYHGINHWAADPLANANTFAFPVLFATFLFIAYVLLYALTHLPRPQVISPSFQKAGT